MEGDLELMLGNTLIWIIAGKKIHIPKRPPG
jgi:hypothetical protein